MECKTHIPYLLRKYPLFTNDLVRVNSAWKIQRSTESHFEMGRVKPEDTYMATSYESGCQIY